MEGKRIIFHVDVNSAYLSWEATWRLQHGEAIDLREVPCVVGGDEASRHGIVLAKSLSAKKYKIKTGESLFEARKKCPNLKIVPPCYEIYMQCSNAMLEILGQYSPCVQRISVDECFLDYTNMECHFGDSVEAAYEIKDRICRELGFTVNVGISNNKLLAKMAGELEKPDKVLTLFPAEVPVKMWPMDIEELYMVGSRIAPKLRARGIRTIGDLANFNPKLIHYYLKNHGTLVWNYANGIEASPVTKNTTIPVKGISNSTTIAFDVYDRKTAHMILLSLVETASMRLRASNFSARLISVSIRTSELLRYSHQRKRDAPTDYTNEIFHDVCQLFDEAWKGQPIRHLGVRLSELCGNDFYQMSIFDNSNCEKKRELDKTIDNIRLRYGAKSVIRAGFVNSGVSPLTGGIIDEYPVMTSLL